MRDNPSTINNQTIRALADEIRGELGQALGTVQDLDHSIFGPRPADESESKDPRSDLRASLDQSLSRLRRLNQALTALNNGVGIQQNALQQSNAAAERY